MLISRNINNYDDLLSRRFVPGNFLQSSLWRDFLTKQNKKWWQLVVTDDLEKVIATCLLYENKLFLGKSYLYSPKGPVWLSGDLSTGEKQEALGLILSQIRDITIITNEQEELFCKLELSEKVPPPPELIKSQDVQPAYTWVLDLDQDVKLLLTGMHPKTRYNIALAQRRGVKIRTSQNQEDLKHFLRLLPGTAKRQGVKFHHNDYYKKLWETIIDHNAGQLYLAELNSRVIAVNLIINFGEATTYLHGVSDYKYRSLMAPHLLQWQAIKDAQATAKKIYDFWGVCDEKGRPENWQGITRFKYGFGGRLISSPGAANFIYNKQWYSFYLRSKKIIHWFR